MVYLIHFDEPYYHAQHYVGYCEDNQLGRRVWRHEHGKGSNLMKVVTRAGILWSVVRKWPGADRNFERKIKKTNSIPYYCPICRKKRRRK